MERVFLNDKMPLVSAVAEWLGVRARATPGGVPSLAHMLVVVPTRQAGRRLRLALAERFATGCLPPQIRLPLQAIAPSHPPASPVATPAESLGVLCRLLLTLDLALFPNLFPEKGRPRTKTFPWALGVARQLHDLWGLLEENALDMRDVAVRIDALLSGEDLDVEIARWQDLAQLEALFFDALLRLGRTPAPAARKQAVADPSLPDGVEDVVLPALTDAVPALYAALEHLIDRARLSVLIHADPSLDARFDVWGRPEPAQWLGANEPRLTLADEQITLAANATEQARLVADLFAAVPPDEALPALGLADDALFNELQSAFINRGQTLHNPAHYPLAASSLGRLTGHIARLVREPRYAVLAAFLREADVIRWLETRLPLGSGGFAEILSALDDLQNAHLPQTFADARRFCEQEQAQAQAQAAPDANAVRIWENLRRTLAEVAALLDPDGRTHLDHLSKTLQTLFSSRVLQEEAPGDRELAAAAEAALGVFEALASPLLEDALDDDQRARLFETLVSSTYYQLEPENTESLLTEGWLELPWSPARELVVAGFNEGCVPEAVVGHAFLPDRLRQGLGLMNNERRTARDTYLLHALLTSRPPGAVHLFLGRASDTRDALKPSRLLFLCDDATLAARAKKLFRDAEKTAVGHRRSLPDAWRLNLPIPAAPPSRVNVTGLSDYLKCPFTFYLKHVLNMEAHDDRTDELDPAAFGDLCHTALDAFGKSDFKDASDAEAIAAFLESHVWQRVKSQYGPALPAVIHLQTAAACKRLSFFAARQARLRAEGWRIAETEQTLSLHEHGLTLRGRVDRIDQQPDTGAWRIIDYKTWDRLGKKGGAERFLSSSRADIEDAAQRGLKPFPFEGKPHVWTDLQLPLYRLMLEAQGRVTADTTVECGYFTLGETEAETVCAIWNFAPVREASIAYLHRLTDRLKAGVFWPPSRKQEWSRDYAPLFLETPEKSVGLDWIRDQEAHLSSAAGGAPCA